MAARPCRGGVRLVADHLQRGQVRDGAASKSRSATAARCCSLIPIPCLKADMAPPLLNLDGIRLTFGGTPLLDGAALDGFRRRQDRAGRPQRFRQVDAAEDRRRADRAAGRRGVPPAFGDGPLSAANARHGGFRHRPRLCRGRAWARRRSLPRHLSDGASRPHRRRKARTISPAARRGAPPLPASWRRSPIFCCLMSRPTISICRSSNGWKRSLSAPPRR